MQPRLRRRRDVAPGVDVVGHRRTERRGVRSLRRRQALHPGAVQLDAIDVAADRAALGAREIHPAARLVDAVKRAHLPLPAGHLLDERAVGAVVIEVPPSGPVADPEKRAVAQPRRRLHIVGADPVLAGFPQDGSRRAGGRVRGIQFEPGLRAVLHGVDHAPAVGRPGDANDQPIGGGILRRVHPGRRAAGDPRHAEPDDRIRIAGLRIVPLLDVLLVRDVIDDRIRRHRRVVDPQKRQRARIGAPPVRAGVAPSVDLLLVDPVQPAVENLRRAVLGQRGFVAGREVGHIQVVAAHERDRLAVGAERCLLFRAGRVRQSHGASVVERIAVQVVGQLGRSPRYARC